MARMQAVVATAKGGPEVLDAQDIPLKWPAGAQDVLVRLKAASINPADLYFRAYGAYIDHGAPLVLGHDGAGIVEAVGPAVSTIKPGDRVCFCYGGIGASNGTYAEFAVVPAAVLVTVPASISFETAAALPLVSITLMESLVERAKLHAGEFALIHAGAGGTGHVGIQIARWLGARVATTVSGDAKAQLVTDLGADLAIRYREQDFVALARDWSGKGVDVALDNVGPEIMQRTLRAMAPYGRIVTLMGTPADTDDLVAYNMNLTIHNVMMLTPMWLDLTERFPIQAGYVREAIRLVETGRLRAVVDRIFPLGDAGAAHRYLESGQSVGKIVLTM